MEKQPNVLEVLSQESVALKLADKIAETSQLHLEDNFKDKYLDLYAECLIAVRKPGQRLSS